jgi:hypothetical protein
MAVRTEETPQHRVLRELYRHYLEFRDFVSQPEHDGQGGYGNSDGVIDYGYYVMRPALADLLSAKNYEDRSWGEVLKKFSREELLATGGVEEVPSLRLDCTPRLDEDGNQVYDLKPIVRQVRITVSFWDLQDALRYLAPRKREAVFHNVIRDQKQKDVAKIMKITTVSVGQYVESAMLQLSETYFADGIMTIDEEEVVGVVS